MQPAILQSLKHLTFQLLDHLQISGGELPLHVFVLDFDFEEGCCFMQNNGIIDDSHIMSIADLVTAMAIGITA